MSLTQLISKLTVTEVAHFKDHLDQKNKRNDVRNIALFKAYQKKDTSSIKKEIGTNAFNALNKRLKDSLFDFLGNEAIRTEVTQEVELMKSIFVARRLLAQNEEKFALTLLNQAEVKAKDNGHYGILNELYHTKIEYAYLLKQEDRNRLYENYKINQEIASNTERLNIVLSEIKSQYNNRNSKCLEVDLKQTMQTLLENHKVNKDFALSYKTLFQLLEIQDIQGSVNRNYSDLEEFYDSYLSQLEDKAKHTTYDLKYKLEVYYTLANIYFRKLAFEKSKFYLNKLDDLEIESSTNYNRIRKIKSLTISILIDNYTGNWQKALIDLEIFKVQHKLTKDEMLNPLLIQAMIYLQQRDLSNCKSVISNLNRTDAYYESLEGVEWVMQKNLLEIILFTELQDVDYVESKLLSLRRRYSSYFKENKDHQLWNFVALIKRYLKYPDRIKTVEFKKIVENKLVWKDKEDVFLMSFYAWLKSKMTEKDIYSITLQLIENQAE